MTSFEMEVGLITYENNGSFRLLPGYKFDPTDEVLVDFYLKRKVFSQTLHVQIIPDFNVFQTEPWGLPGGDENIFNECKFFFYNMLGCDLTNLDMRVVASGQWEVVEKDKDIPIPRNNKVIGKRNTLIFWDVEGACARMIKWVMHEVLIVNPSEMVKWVVCCIFQKNDEKKVKKTRGSEGRNSNGERDGGSVEVIDFNENGSFSGPPPMTSDDNESS